MGVKINLQGLLGLIAIAFMIGVVFYKEWRIPWLYFGAAVLFYSGAVIALSVWQEEEKGKLSTLRYEMATPRERDTHQRDTLMIVEEMNESQVVLFTLFRALLGCHLAFVFQALGIVFDIGDSIVIRIGYFLASLAIGLAIPFLALTRRDEGAANDPAVVPDDQQK